MSKDLQKYFDEYVSKSIDRPAIVKATLEQVKKDFSLQGIELSLDLSQTEGLINTLADKLKDLDLAHNSKLGAILYQLDLNEVKISKKLRSVNPESWYVLLAEEILKRCFEKVAWRLKLKT